MDRQVKHGKLREDILKLAHLKLDVLKKQEHSKAAKGLHDKLMETRPMYKWKHERAMKQKGQDLGKKKSDLLAYFSVNSQCDVYMSVR
jgi:hypothetical protein